MILCLYGLIAADEGGCEAAEMHNERSCGHLAMHTMCRLVAVSASAIEHEKLLLLFGGGCCHERFEFRNSKCLRNARRRLVAASRFVGNLLQLMVRHFGLFDLNDLEIEL